MWKILCKNIIACLDIAIFALEYFILPHPVYKSIIHIDIDIDTDIPTYSRILVKHREIYIPHMYSVLIQQVNGIIVHRGRF